MASTVSKGIASSQDSAVIDSVHDSHSELQNNTVQEQSETATTSFATISSAASDLLPSSRQATMTPATARIKPAIASINTDLTRRPSSQEGIMADRVLSIPTAGRVTSFITPDTSPGTSSGAILPGSSHVANTNPISSSAASLLSINYTANVSDMLMTTQDILNHHHYSDSERTHRLESMYIRAASNGDIGRLHECLYSEAADWIDLDAAEEEGTTALISAACFGHVEVIRMLLDAGAGIDCCDKNGWTPLMWACANGYQAAAKVLIEAGANKQAKSNRGRSIVDLSTKNGNSEIVRILDPGLADNRERKAARVAARALAKAAKLAGTACANDQTASQGSSADENTESDDDLPDPDQLSLDSSDDDFDFMPLETTFQWDSCRPDQMFVFEEANIDHVVDVIVRRIRPGRGPDYVPVGANTIFLCARYAHYWNSDSMLCTFLNQSIERIVSALQACPDDIHFCAYWLSNAMQLLVYMKRDTGLLVSTFDSQCRLSELIQEIYQQLVASIERSIGSLIDPAIIDYRKMHATSRVRYEPVFFGIGKRKSLLKLNQEYSPPRSPRSARSTRSHSSIPQYEVTPASINSILGSTLNVLKSCKVHEQVVHQLFHQLLYFLNAEVFNRVLTTNELCSRARAQQIQLNIAAIQDWVREHAAALPQITGPAASFGRGGALVQHLRPSMQLTQFLQVASTCGADLGGFLELIGSMNILTTAQLHKVMENYRYEVGEASFPPDVEAYVQKLIDELAVEKKRGVEALAQMKRSGHRSEEQSMDTPSVATENNLDSIVDAQLDMTRTKSDAKSEGTAMFDTKMMDEPEQVHNVDMDEVNDALNPLIDTRFILPFSVPTPGRDDLLWSSIPSIPPQVMGMMDDTSSLEVREKTAENQTVSVSRESVMGGLYRPTSLASFRPLAITASNYLTPIFNSVRFSTS
ncbi:hypothetical protein QVD99_002539 [Batrachochytrium dendrobatidis]|nr:hypothetical protein QVD99_002539 [Batrachochytrium dendrobatidis]